MRKLHVLAFLFIVCFKVSYGGFYNTYEYGHFVPCWSGNGVDHMNFYAISATLDGISLEMNDEIAVFDGDLCVGAGVLLESLSPGVYFLDFVASKDDETTPEIDGYTPSNVISFKIFDYSEQKEIEKIETEFISGSGVFSEGGTLSFHLSAKSTVDQIIDLQEGWNIISFFNMPENTDLMTFLQPLIDNGTLIKVQDEAGNAIEYVEPIGWVNNIPNFDPTEGYKIKLSSEAELVTEGYEVPDTISIDLQEGWNIISYPFSEAQSATLAIAKLINEGSLIKVQDEAGNAIENVFPIGWVYNIAQLEPGEGYKIKVNTNTTLELYRPGNKKSATAFLTQEEDDLHYFKKVWSGNGLDHMNFYIINATAGGIDLQAGDEIAVYDGNYCVGAAPLTEVLSGAQSYLTFVASKNDVQPPSVNGYTPGNTYRFKFWDKSEDLLINDVSIELLYGTAEFGIGGTVSCNLTGTINDRPVANARNDFSVEEGTIVTLNGEDSNDPENDPISYAWTSPEGITLSDATSKNPQFTAPDVVMDSVIIFVLVVNDGNNNSYPDTLRITVTHINSAPEFISMPIESATTGQQYEYLIRTNDADPGDQLIIEATEIPGWLSLIDYGDGTAMLSGTPTAETIGNANVTVTLTDQIITAPVQQSFIINVLTGIVNISSDDNLLVYPNPAKEFARVIFNKQLEMNGKIKVVDLLGTSHAEMDYKAENGENEIFLNLDGLKPGIYFLVVESKQVKWSRKIIIQK